MIFYIFKFRFLFAAAIFLIAQRKTGTKRFRCSTVSFYCLNYFYCFFHTIGPFEFAFLPHFLDLATSKERRKERAVESL